MIKEIDLLKKEQRSILSSSRKVLKKKININGDYFKRLLRCSWFNNSKIIASFISINSEISTLSLNNFIKNCDKILCLPVIEKRNNGRLVFKSYQKGDDLVIGKFNIKEPIKSKVLLPDIIFTPCLGFDLSGFRLGYGGGYYDKTIDSFNRNGHMFTTVGFAYDNQKVDSIIHDTYDQRLDFILTEKQLYKSL